MKRILGMILVMGMLASVAMAATNVTSVNAVGYNSVTIEPGELALVCLPFETFDDSTIDNLVGDQLPTGSAAWIWDRGSGAYVSSTRGRGGWNGTNIILRGDAFWLQNAGTETNTVTFLGEVPEDYNDAGTTTVFNIDGADAVGYAYPTDVQWTNTTLSSDLPSASALYIWDMVGQTYTTYTKGRGGWNTPVGFSISAGSAFWVNSSTPIDWTEIAPYDL